MHKLWDRPALYSNQGSAWQLRLDIELLQTFDSDW